MTGVRKFLTNFLSTTLQKEDLIMSRLSSTMDDFNFAPRKELSLSVDVAFKLHGTILMFYHFDKNFVMSVMGCKYDQVIFSPFKQLFLFIFYNSCKELGFPARSVF